LADEKTTIAVNTSEEEDIESTPIYRKKKILIPLLIFIIIGVAAWYWYMGNKGFVSTDDAFIDADKATISSKSSEELLVLKLRKGIQLKWVRFLFSLIRLT